MEAVETRGLVKRYGSADHGLVAVDGLNLRVHRGECFGLLGLNGAGKTTTIEILEGLLAPTAGEVEVLGRHWETDERELRQRIGVSLQDTNFADRMTVEETLRMFASFYERPRDVEDMLRVVSLVDERRARYDTLSGGLKQRLALACGLVGDPELLFLDEPTTGLDPQSRRQLWDQIEAFRARNGTVLLTTHYMDEAQRLCDRVAIVDHGKVIAQGTPTELIESLRGVEVVELALAHDGVDEARLAALPGVHAVRHHAGRWELDVDHVHVAIPALLGYLETAQLPLTYLSTHRATLEDVFVHLTGSRLRA